MKKHIFSFFIYLILLSGIFIPQIFFGQTSFQKVYKVQTTNIMSVWQNSDGGYVFGAPRTGVSNITRTDASGNILWSKQINQPVSGLSGIVQQTYDGGFIWTGVHGGIVGQFSRKIYLNKFDMNGNLLWTKLYGGVSGVDLANTMAQTTDGGFIISGITSSFGTSLTKYLLKTDSNGALEWSKVFGDQGSSTSFVIQTNDNGYALVGTQNQAPIGFNSASLLKTDSGGNLLWNKIYGNTGLAESTVFRSGRETNDGGFIIVGSHTVSPFSQLGVHDILVVKTNSNGNVLWSKTYGTTNHEEGSDIQQTSDGGFIVSGDAATGQNLFQNYDKCLLKINSSGNIQWAKLYGGTNGDAADLPHSLQITSDGGYATVGSTSSFGGTLDFYFIKTDAVGNSGCNESNAVFTEAMRNTQDITFSTNTSTPPTVLINFTPTIGTPSVVVSSLCGITPLTVSVSHADNICNGGCLGTATATPSGSTTPYTFFWSPTGQTTPAATGLCAGTYTVVVIDASGATASGIVSITEPTAITITATQTNASCFGGNNGTASVTASGGTPPYIYVWSNGQTTSSATGLSAGNYSVIITDANGCTAIATVIITEPATLTLVTSQTNVSCFGGSNGSATVNVSGGTPPYIHVWSNGQTTATATGLFAGTYSVTVSDANGCNATASVVIIEPLQLVANAGADQTIIIGQITALTAIVSGGTPSYSFLWSTGQTAQSITVSPTVTTTYTVTVIDMNGCSSNDNVTVFVQQPQDCSNFKCGNKNEKVVICHIPPGNPGNPQTLCISPNALSAHLAHGDYCGPCINYRITSSDIQEESTPINLIEVYPNPFNDNTTISIHLSYPEKVKVEVFNLIGNKVALLFDNNADSGTLNVSFSGNGLPDGVCIGKITLSDKEYFQKLLLLNTY
ncbi:MAG: T9SS type A sorting domain-containing protein [Bacteroidetes bacterium]|nr:T9SS type A sorting domain-containing protein [Bacteroidota bacterium]